MKRYEFTVPGEPVPKGRPRFTKAGGVYTPKKTKDAEVAIRGYALEAGLRKPKPGRVQIGVYFWRKSKRKADLDNLAKLVLDALNKVAWEDDDQVEAMTIQKSHDPIQPRTDVYITFIDA